MNCKCIIYVFAVRMETTKWKNLITLCFSCREKIHIELLEALFGLGADATD
jgi:hypothetical protein